MKGAKRGSKMQVPDAYSSPVARKAFLAGHVAGYYAGYMARKRGEANRQGRAGVRKRKGAKP